jgi:site-specific recombinase XerD
LTLSGLNDVKPRDSDFVFTTQRSGPFTPDAVNRLIKRIGARAGLSFTVHATCSATPADTR